MYDPSKPYKQRLLELIESTWDTPYINVQRGVYPVTKRKVEGYDLDHTDGIGTKGVYHWAQQSFAEAAQDALAMNLNDLALMRATPYKLQNHIVLPSGDNKAAPLIITELALLCRKYQIAMTGGETSHQDTMQGMDLSISVTGFLDTILPNLLKPGDVLVGLPSSGLHSNGFSKVRALFGDTVRPEFIVPTTIYIDTVSRLGDAVDIHGMMHMTGGSYAKLLDILPKDADITIRRAHFLVPQSIFKEIYETGVTDKDMYQTFNCGIGFIMGMSAADAERALDLAPEAAIVGKVTAGKGQVHVESSFSHKLVTY